ncbi:hypothetical protein [Streptomyces sp. UG1]|uniref:hypothetical protein n=1 Tax=Streptomyces sp. UG1 TaxID=3417652 RepID=UPI003CF18125
MASAEASLESSDLTVMDPVIVQEAETGEGGAASFEGPDRDRNIVYLPRREHAGQCVATGAFASLTQADYTSPPRKKLDFPLPGLQTLPVDNRARGHLIGFTMGGSGRKFRSGGSRLWRSQIK